MPDPTAPVADRIRPRLRRTPRPPRVLDEAREAALTPRQREVLDRLTTLLDEGFANTTMAHLAGRAGCSLRTLYTLAPTRDDLVLTVVDRRLWSVGRAATHILRSETSPLAALRAYLLATTTVIADWSDAFARDIAAVARARALRDAHDEYIYRVTKALLDLAVDAGEIRPVDTAGVARVLAELGRIFTRPTVLPTLTRSPQRTTDHLVEVVLAGLAPTRHDHA